MKNEEIRHNVSKAYSQAITNTQSSCGCSSSCCSGPPDTLGYATLSGYGKEEVEAMPGVAQSSFGCGNPLAFSDVQKGDVVLDLGSGAGFDLLIASPKVGPEGKVIGVDMTDAMIETARRNIKAAGVKNVEIRKGIIEQLPVESNSVDWVISNCVINLSPEKSKVFAEIHRVLKPGGRMRVSDIVAKDLPHEIITNSNLYFACVAGAVSEEEYVAGLKRAGLAEVEVPERLIYDKTQLSGLIGADTENVWGVIFENLPKEERQRAGEALLDQLVGKIWSAKFSAVRR